MVTEQRREERARSLKSALEMADLNPRGNRTTARWAIHSKFILHDDIEDGVDGPDYYGFTDAQRDRLIAHARQDAAHAVFGVHDAYKAARDARLWSWFSFVLNIIMLGILVYVFFL